MLFALRISLIPCCLNDKFYIWRKSPPDLLVFWYNVPQLEILMKLKDDPMAYAIVGCAMRVHDTLGPGFLESAYGDALEIEFAKSGIPYAREDEVRIFYDGRPLKTTYRADFTCFDRRYIVELKAIKSLSRIEWAQVIHYMRATQTRYALLINFGREEFQYDTFDLESLPKSSVIDNQPQSTSSLGSCNLGKKRGAKP